MGTNKGSVDIIFRGKKSRISLYSQRTGAWFIKEKKEVILLLRESVEIQDIEVNF